MVFVFLHVMSTIEIYTSLFFVSVICVKETVYKPRITVYNPYNLFNPCNPYSSYNLYDGPKRLKT